MHKNVAFGKKLLCAWVIISLMTGCAYIKNIFSPEQMETPSVKLNRVEVVKESGYWYYAENNPTTEGDPGKRGAPLSLAFVFKIKNPNTYVIRMDSFNFEVKYENTTLDEIKLKDTLWIPSGKVNELRVYSLLDVHSASLNLLAQQGEELKEKNISIWSVLKMYWTDIPQFEKAIQVTEGEAEFTAKNRSKTVFFSAAYRKDAMKEEKDEKKQD